MSTQPDWIQALDPTRTYIAWVKELKALPHLSRVDWPVNVVMGLAAEVVDIITLEEAVKKLGYKLVPIEDRDE